MTQLVRLADRLLGRPLLITPDKAQVILSVLSGRIGMPAANRFEGDPYERDNSGRPVKVLNYKVTDDGVGIISIVGSLVNRGAWIGAESGLVSYEGITQQIKSIINDKKVHSVILDIDSPGGEAIGCFELAAVIRQLSDQKTTIAVVNGMACSAAYAIASGATEIVTTETGASGSIGVVWLHADFSRQLDKDGVTATFIYAGDHKVDGNSFEPLSDAVKLDKQAEIDTFYNSFLTSVAKGRGKRLNAAAAKKTQARIFIGQAAVDAGLADRVGTFDMVLSQLSRAKGRSTVQSRRKAMDDNIDETTAELATGVSKLEHSNAIASARQEGEQAGTQATCDRFKSIVSAENIAGNPSRMAAAIDLAIKSPSMTAENVIAFISANISDQPKVSAASLVNRVAATGSTSLLGLPDQTTAKPEGRLTSLAKKQNGGSHEQF